MPAAPLPHDERERLAALRALGILDTPDEERFDRLVRIAAASLDVPIAAVSLVDEHRQWCKAGVGLDAREIPREMAFCAHAILDPTTTLVVEDAGCDPRFADNPVVTGESGLRFYAGRVISDPDGHPLGTLCVADRAPRGLRPRDRQVLADLATLVEQELTHAARDELVVALERSERSKATLLDALTEGFVVQDRDGRIVEWNRAANDLLGLSDAELACRTPIDPRWRAVHADGSPWPNDTHPALETLRTGEPVSNRTMGVHRPDGTLVWLRVDARPVLDRAGDVASVLTVFADIAADFDRERASETMALRLRQAVDSSAIGTALLGSDGATLFANEAYAAILGASHDQILGRPPTVWIHPDDPQYGGRDFSTVDVASDTFISSEIRLLDHDGTQRWVRAHLTRLADDPTDGPAGDRFVLQLEDVTEQRQLRTALGHSEEIARASLEALEQGVVLADATGAIHQINSAAERILGHTGPELSELFGSSSWLTYDEHGRPIPVERRPISRVVTTRQPVRGEIVGWRHRDGHLVLLRVSCIPVPDSESGTGRFVVAFADVTEQLRSQRLIDATFALAPVGLALIDDDRSVLRWNPTFAALAGATGPDVSGDALEPILDLAPDGESTATQTGHELRLLGSDGEETWVETRCAWFDDVERAVRIVATFDITERKRLELDQERFSHLFRHANDIITVVDTTGQVLYASPSNERVLGYPDGWRSPGGILDLVHPDDLPAAAAEFLSLLAGERGPEPFTMRVRTYTDEWKYIETIGTNLVDEPSVRGIVLTSRDVTERQLLSDELARRATHDALTGLANRAAAEERLDAAIARAREHRSVVGVCYLDLDGFKEVNDTLGHAAGDAMLVDVADRLGGAVRGTDLPARIGGDEFVVVLEGVGSAEHAMTVADRLLHRLTSPPLRTGELTVGVSIGVAVSQPDDSADSLLSRADNALYRAKELAHSGVVLDSGIDLPSIG